MARSARTPAPLQERAWFEGIQNWAFDIIAFFLLGWYKIFGTTPEMRANNLFNKGWMDLIWAVKTHRDQTRVAIISSVGLIEAFLDHVPIDRIPVLGRIFTRVEGKMREALEQLADVVLRYGAEQHITFPADYQPSFPDIDAIVAEWARWLKETIGNWKEQLTELLSIVVPFLAGPLKDHEEFAMTFGTMSEAEIAVWASFIISLDDEGRQFVVRSYGFLKNPLFLRELLRPGLTNDQRLAMLKTVSENAVTIAAGSVGRGLKTVVSGATTPLKAAFTAHRAACDTRANTNNPRQP